jgi:hypothetical protein
LRSSGRSAARARDKATLTRGKASEKLVEAVDRLEEKIKAFHIADDRSGSGERAEHD